MSEQPSPLSEEQATEIFRQLRQKEGNWVNWGKSCQQLQKAGYNTQSIFEATGFEPIHQNQVIVATQVYDTIVQTGIAENIEQHFAKKGSDVLYEFRILPPKERTQAATLAVEKQLTQPEAHDIAKAIKEFSYLQSLPEGFTDTAGDAIAYHYWKLARGKKDLQARSRLIAQGLRYAESNTAREKIERLLSDFTVVPTTPAPSLPLYRLEQEEELPRMMPVLNSLKVDVATYEKVSPPQSQGTFSITEVSTKDKWVALPGWQMIVAASDPIAILCEREELPKSDSLAKEPFLVVIDRGDTRWYLHSYFLVEQEDGLGIQWFEQQPKQKLLGKVILVLRPKRIIDEGAIAASWQIEE